MRMLKNESINQWQLLERSSSLDMVTWIVIGICILLILTVRLIHVDYIPFIFSRQKNKSDVLPLWSWSSVLLILNFFLIFSLSLFHLSQLLIRSWMPTFYLIILAAISGLYLSKLVVSSVIRRVFEYKAPFYVKIYSYFFQTAGIILLPIYIFSYFISTSYQSAIFILFLSIFIILVLIREIKGLIKAFSYKISLFYIILYLCTLEILPLVLIVKYLKDLNQVAL